MANSKMAPDAPVSLTSEEFDSLREVGKGDAQGDIPQMHWERLVALGYALRRLGTLGLTESGKQLREEAAFFFRLGFPQRT